MKLSQLLRGVNVNAVKGEKYLNIENIAYDSKQVRPAGLFFAIKGEKMNGLNFVDEAIERGAICVVSQEDFITFKNVCKVIVPDARKACAEIANNFYEYPSDKMSVVGITGTNGKTTTLCIIESILMHSGKRCGTIGTIEYCIGDRRIPASNTTPSSIMIQMFLGEMLKSGINNCAMEVSSHSLCQRRVDGIKFSGAVFTNLSGEHLDYHKTMDAYFAAKKMLFDMLGTEACAVVNTDDEYGVKLAQSVKGGLVTYGIEKQADFMAFDIRSSVKGSTFQIRTPGGEFGVKTGLIGNFNIYNILSAAAYTITKGTDPKYVTEALKVFKGAPGRLQRVECGQDFSVFVDYAHTDDALAKVLSALRELTKSRLITVFGCGGDRDRTKRPRMAAAAAQYSDLVVLTSDNPRSEEPKDIIDEIAKGFPKGFKNYKTYVDRKKAIEAALSSAKEGDIVLLAGKGHEKCQIFKDTTVPFDDVKTAEEFLGSKEALLKA